MPDIGNPVDVRSLFAVERRDLIELLESLESDDWWSPTVCGDWSVHDVSIHLLGADVNLLSGGRDRFGGSPLGPAPGDLDDWATLVAFIDQRNAAWVEGLRRISPPLLIELLEWTGQCMDDWLSGIDMDAPGIPVSWAGPEPAPTWFHIARELTEQWTHQQHIRLAVDRPGADDPTLVGAVLDTFARALPHTMHDLDLPDGTSARLIVSGEGGGSWTVERQMGEWRFAIGAIQEPDCTVRCDVETAWQSFTLGLTPSERRARMSYVGNPDLANRIVDMVSIIG